MTQVILVDENDNELGSMEKLAAHEQARLHRAFSVFLFNGDKTLLQQRAAGKYHCPLLWANACCSHPQPGESVEQAARRRLVEELGIQVGDIRELGSFTYRADFGNGLSEHEFDHVLAARYHGDITPNPAEIAALRWVSRAELEEELRLNPTAFAPWFRLIIEQQAQLLWG